MKVALILYIITSYGGVTTQHIDDFDSYQDCASFAAGYIDSQRDLYSDAKLKWECNPR